MKQKLRIRERFVIAWKNGEELVTEGHNDPAKVNERLNELWALNPHLQHQDPRRPRAFLLEKLHLYYNVRVA